MKKEHVRATPNQEMGPNCVKKKDKMADGFPKRLCASYFLLNGADICGEWTGHFRSSGEQKWKSNWSEKIIAWSYCPNIYAQ